MREYQTVKNNAYHLPHNLYMQVLYIIRDYDRLKEEYTAILESGSAPGYVIAPRGGGAPSSPTEVKAMLLAGISTEMHAVEQALLDIAEEYRKPLLLNIKYRIPYPSWAHYNTWRSQRYKFTYGVAKRLDLA